MRPPWRQAASILAGAAACTMQPTDSGRLVSTVMRLDVRPLWESSAYGRGLTVAETLALVVKPRSGDPVPARVVFGRSDTVKRAVVTIPQGTAIFEATVLSNNGTTLYRGTETTNVQKDNSEIRVQVVPASPVLAVFPDSLTDSLGGVEGTFLVVNIGRDTLAWSVAGVTPTVPIIPSCSPVTGEPCFYLSRLSGAAIVGRADTLHVRVVSIPARTYSLTIASPVGSVDVRILVR